MMIATIASAQAPAAPALRGPPGFHIVAFAEGLEGPRALGLGPEGGLYVSLTRSGRIARMIDADGDGRADTTAIVIGGLDRPQGLSWQGEDLWVAEPTRVLRLTGVPRSEPGIEVVIDGLPDGGHVTRAILFEPGGRGFFVSVGSSCNLCLEEDRRRATILRYAPTGEGPVVWATGLRNVMGLALNPETGELWVTENGREGLGDALPPDEIDVVRRGGDYGWPYCYGVRIANPEWADPNRCDPTEPSDLDLPAHSAPAGIAFYTDTLFPEPYRHGAFVALRGSWGRPLSAGYALAFVPLDRGRPAGVQEFVTGWRSAGGEPLGRPVDVLVGHDGALYVSDDRGGRVWRIAYEDGLPGTGRTRPGR